MLAPMTARPAGEQDYRGDRTGAAHQRHREGKGGEIVDVVDRHRIGREFLLSLAALGENHLKRCIKKQKPARDSERWQGNAESGHDRGAAKCEDEKNGGKR